MKKNKMLISGLCICFFCAMIITAAAVTKYKYSSAAGDTVSNVINRVNFTVKNTEFEFSDVSSDGTLSCVSVISIEKTEPDFVGKLDSISLSGQNFSNIVYSPGKNNDDTILPENAVLPVDAEGKTYPLSWEVTYTFPYEEGKSTYNINIDINYTTGVKQGLEQQYCTSVPVTVTVK